MRAVQWLQRYGYLGVGPSAAADSSIQAAWSQMQRFFLLQDTGRPDPESLLITKLFRCGLPDVLPARVSTGCRWPVDELTYAYESTTSDLPATDVRRMISAAFSSWAAVVPVVFREVSPTTPTPDVRIAWRPSGDPDLSMVGETIAHADFPLGCSILGNRLPLPMHFDDQECTWKDGAVHGAFDIQTVALHEIGHLLGLGHSSDPEAVMAPAISPNSTKRNLTQADLDAVAMLYG